eukprot:5984352-Pleurochrysis_carterae.AAC.1
MHSHAPTHTHAHAPFHSAFPIAPHRIAPQAKRAHAPGHTRTRAHEQAVFFHTRAVCSRERRLSCVQVCVGAFQPCIATLRSKYVPDAMQSTINNLF